MTTFKTRDAANTTPDLMGDTYKFIKLNLDDYVAFVDGLTENVYREHGTVAMFLEKTQPEFHWYVSPDRIYFTSNEDYPEEAYDDFEFIDDDGVTTIRRGIKSEFLHPNMFSETQKWVKKIEELTLSSDKVWIEPSVVRAWVKQATGK